MRPASLTIGPVGWVGHYSVVPVGVAVEGLPVVGAGAGAGGGAGSGAAGAIVGVAAGVGCGAGATFGATLRVAGGFFGFAVFRATRLGARRATTFFFALLARFTTRFFAFTLLFDLARLLGLADRFVFAFLAMWVAPCCVDPSAPTVAGVLETCEAHCSRRNGTNFLSVRSTATFSIPIFGQNCKDM
jgi:hypothetical protein